MSALKRVLFKDLSYVGRGKKSIFYEITYNPNHMFFVFKNTRYIVAYDDSIKKSLFFKIINTKEEINVPENFYFDFVCFRDDIIYSTAYEWTDSVESHDLGAIVRVSPEEIIEKFSKQYKFLMYEINNLQ